MERIFHKAAVVAQGGQDWSTGDRQNNTMEGQHDELLGFAAFL